MYKAINLHGKKFISARRASEITGYTSDYVGQLCRAKKINSTLIERTWYVSEKEILEHKSKHKNSLKHWSNIDRSSIVSNKKKILKNSLVPKKIIGSIVPSVVVSTNEPKPITKSGIIYIKDDKPLFPIPIKKFDVNATKFIALKSIEDSIKKPIKSPFIDKFAFNSTLVSLVLILAFGFVFEKEGVSKLINSDFGNHIKGELSFLYNPYVKNVKDEYIEFKGSISNINKNSEQVASSVFSVNGWQSFSGWVKGVAYKIAKPWLEKTSVLVNNAPQPPLTSRGREGVARTTIIAGADRDYVDTKIEELRNYFLTLPLTSSTVPNVNRYYITNQNDRIVDLIARSSSGSSTSGGGTSNVAVLSDLTDISLASPTYGDVLLYDGTNWINVATSTLGIIGTGTASSFGQAWEVDSNGFLSPTTTIAVLFANASSTLFSSTYASSTNAYFGSLSLNGTDLQTSLNTLTNGKISVGTTSVDSITTLNNLSITKSQVSDFGTYLTSYDAFTHPSVGISATSSQLTVSGLLSTASSTFTTNLYLPSLSQGLAYVGSNGLLNTTASSSLFGFTPISNQLTKGYTIVGDDFGTAQATSSIFVSSTGNVGVGTTSPSAKFSIDTSGSNITPLIIKTNASTGNNTPESSGIFVKNANGGESLRIFAPLRYANDIYSSLFIGLEAGFSYDNNVDSYTNLGIGTRALYSNSTGYENIALGTNSLYENTTGSRNTALGNYSLNFNTEGNSNIAIGVYASELNTTGSSNVAIGDSALDWNVDGSYNVVIGKEAFASAWQTSSANTAVGYRSGYGNNGDGYSSSNNSFFGYQSGYNIRTGSNNILIGYKAGDTLTTGSNNLVIGYDQDVLASNTNNFLNIGGAIYGNFGTGNIGIGTTSPSYKLDVMGGIASYGQSFFGGAITATSTLDLTSLSQGFAYLGSGGRVNSIASSSINLSWFNNDSGYLTSAYSGFIEVGTTSVDSIIALNNLSITKSQVSDFGTYENPLTFTYPIQRNTNAISLAFGTTTNNVWSGTNTFSLAPTLSSVAINSLLSTNASGQVVATSTPTFGFFNATSTTATSTIAGGLVIGASKFVVDSSTGNVGIGIAAPTSKLHIDTRTNDVVGSGEIKTDFYSFRSSTSGWDSLSIDISPDGGSTWRTGMSFNAGSSGLNIGGDVNPSTFPATVFIQGTSLDSTLPLLTIASSSDDTLFTIFANGSTGIGSTTPGSLLSIGGDAVGINFGLATSTFSTTGGINLTKGGCFAVNGVCVGGTTYGDSDVNSYIAASSTIPKTYSSNIFTGANIFNGTLTVGSLNGPLQANNGVISATTSIGVLYGGTGLTSYTSGDILYADASGNLAKLPKSSDGLVLKLNSGFPSWQSDLTSGGGGGATAWSTSTNSMIIYPTDTADILVLGSNSTSTIAGTGNIFEVAGNSFFGGNIRTTGNASTTALSAYWFKAGATASTTIDTAGNLITQQATTTNLAITNIPSSLLKTNSDGSVISAIAGVDYQAVGTYLTSYDAFTHPSAGISATSSQLTVSGLLSTASSTFTTNLYLPSLSQGFAYIGTAGKINTIASSSINLSWFNNDSGFLTSSYNGFIEVGTTSVDSITALPNLSITKSQVSDFGTYLTSYDAFTHPWVGSSATTSSFMIGTSTANRYTLTVASSTAPQLSLSAGAGIAQWVFRNAGGNLYFATTTVAGTATSTLSAFSIIGSTGNVGIGTSSPMAKFTVKGGSVLFDGTTGSTPTSGAGTRFMWIPAKAALRAGIVTSDYWDNANIGTNSIALGSNAQATATDSIALGSNAQATGGDGYNSSLAISSGGWSATASNASMAIGNGVRATGEYSVAIGMHSSMHILTAGGIRSLSFGQDTNANSDYSTAIGQWSSTGWNAPRSFAIGNTATANATSSLAMGNAVTVNAINSMVIGAGVYDETQWNYYGNGNELINNTPNTLAIGFNSKNPLMYINNSSVGIGTTTPTWLFQVATSSANGGFKPQFTLSDISAGTKHWNLSSLGGNLYIGTSTDAYATSSISALEISGTGFGTTTVRGLNISAQATSTSNVGWNVTSGCYAVNGVCMTAGTLGALTSYDAFTHPSAGISATSSQLTVSGLLSTASSTFTTNLYLPSLSQGFAYIGTAGKINTIASSSINLSWFNNDSGFLTSATGLTGYDAWTHPSVGISATTSSLSFPYSSSTVYSSFITASTTNLLAGTLSLNGTDLQTSLNTLTNGKISVGTTSVDSITTLNNLSITKSQVSDFGTYLTSYDAFTHPWVGSSATTSSFMIGTSTANPYGLTIASSTASQLSLSTGAGIAQWAFRNAGGNFYLSTTTVAGTATTSISALEVAGTGFGTTTVRGLNISGQATSTSNVGFNITSGCFAIGGTCVGGSITSLNGLTSASQTFATTSTNGGFGFTSTGSTHTLNIPTASSLSLGLLSSTDWSTFNSKLSSSLMKGYFIVGNDSSVAQATSSIFISSTGNVGIGETSPASKLSVGAGVSIGSSYDTIAAPANGLLVEGSVSLGTTNSYNKLDIKGNAGLYSASETSAGSPIGASIYLGDNNFNNSSFYNSAPGLSAVYDASNGVASSLGFYTYTGSSNSRTEKMRITSVGNIGISSTTPGSLLSIGGDAVGINFGLATSTFSTTGGINLTKGGCFAVNGVCVGGTTYGDSDVNSYIHASTTIPKTYTANTFSALQIFTNASSTLFSSTYASSTNGYFGSLSLNGTDLQTSLDTLTNGKISVGTTSVSSITALPNLSITKSQVSDFGTYLTSYDAWTHPSAGYSATTSALSIGTTSAWAKLSVSSYTDSGVANPNPLFVVASSTGTGATSTAFIINSVGNVGVGTANPTNKLKVVGTTETTNLSVNSDSWLTGAVYFYSSIVGNGNSNISISNTGIISTQSTGVLRWSSGTNAGSGPFDVALARNAAGILEIDNGTRGFVSTTTLLVGNIGVGTTTPQYRLTIASSTALTDGAGIAQWVTRNAGGNLYFSTTTVAGTATTSISALEISGSGFGTTTVRGLNISGQATSTSNVGWNITNGCYAVNGVCMTAGTLGALTSYDAFTHPSAGISATSSQLTVSGLLSTASSTFSSDLFLPSLSQGFAYIGTAGKINTIASSSINLSWFNNDSGFLTSATGLTGYDAWTHPATGQSATTSLMLFRGNASSTQLSANQAWFGGTGTTTITNAGWLGVGAASPLASLNIAGDRNIGANWISDSSQTFGGQLLINGVSNPNLRLAFGMDTTNSIGIIQAAQAGTGALPLVLQKNGGSVGIGTAGAPTNQLHVYNGTTASFGLESPNSMIDWRAGDNIDAQLGRASDSRFANIIYANSKTFGSDKQWAVGLRQNNNDYHIYSDGGSFEALTIKQTSGNIGIGTTSPSYKLDVMGGIASYGQSFFGGAITATSTLDLTSLSQGFAYLGSGGRVNSIASSSINLSWFNNDPGFLTSATGLTGYDAWTHPAAEYSATTSALAIGTSSAWAKLSVSSYTDSGVANSNPLFVVASSTGTGATTTAFIIDSVGNVGIGTANPTRKLTVAGDIFPSAGGYSLGNGDNPWSIVGTNQISGSGSATFWLVAGGDVRLVPGATGNTILSPGNVGIGTTTPQYRLTVASSTALTDGAGIAQWVTRNAGGNLYFSTTTVAGTATTSISALEIAGSGFGTTTVRGLNISGQATSTSNVGFNITSGCFAVNGVCVGGSSFTNTLANGGTATTTFYNGGIVFSDGNKLTQSSSPENFFWDETNKRLGLGTSAPSSILSIKGGEIYQDLFNIASSSGASMFNISWFGGLTQNISSSTAVNIQDGSGNPIFVVDTTQSAGAGVDITATTGQTGNLFSLYSSGGTFLSGFNADGGFVQNISSTSSFRIQNGSSVDVLMIDTVSSNVGIGTSTPASKLTVLGGVSIGADYGIASPSNGLIVQGNVGIGTSTPGSLAWLTIASSTALTDGAGVAQWVTRNAGGNLYFSTTTVAGTATTSISALEISGTGFGTTTVRGLNISGQATSTSNVGFNITSGCFAVNGVCVGGGTGSMSSYDAWTHPSAGYSATTSALSIGTTSAWAKLSVSSYTDSGVANSNPLFVVASSTGTLATSTAFIINSVGNVGIGTASPVASLDIKSSGIDMINIRATDGTLKTSFNTLGRLSFQNFAVGNTLIDINGHGILQGDSSMNLGATNAPVSMLDILPSATDRIGQIIKAKASQTADLQQWQDASGNIMVNVTATGNVGVGTTTPWAKLSVNNYSAAGNTAPLFVVASSTGTGATTTAFIINSVGNVGVGKVSPLSTLHVYKNYDESPTGLTGTLMIEGGRSGSIVFRENQGNLAAKITAVADSSGGQLAFSTTNSWGTLYERMRINTTGNVGIGTTNPTGLFDVNGKLTVLSSGKIGIGTSTPTWQLQVSSSTSSATFKPQLALSDYSAGTDLKHWTLSSQGGNFYIASSTDLYATTTDMSALSISGTGFGTTTLRGLNISGQATSTSNVGFNITSGCFAIGGTCIGGGSSSQWTDVAGGINYSGGKVGIGAASPGSALSVVGNQAIQGADGWDGNGDRAILAFGPAGTDATGLENGIFSTYGGPGLSFSVYKSGGTTGIDGNESITAMAIAETTGNVGIGTTSPFAKLSVESTAGIPQFVIGSSTATSFIVDKNGNVGIGTEAPVSILTLKASNPILYMYGETNSMILTDPASPWEYSKFYNSGDVTEIDAGYKLNLIADGNEATEFGGGVLLGSDSTMADYTSTAGNKAVLTVQMDVDGTPSTLMTVRGDTGYVGIGTTDPSELLHIYNASTASIKIQGGVNDRDKWRLQTSDGNSTGLFEIQDFSGGAYVTNLAILGTTGNVGIGTTTPAGLLTLQGAGTAKDLFSIASTTNGLKVITVTQWGGFVQNVSSTTAVDIQNGSGVSVFAVDTTQSGSNAGLDITAAGGQTGNLLNFYSSGGTFLSGFTAAGGLHMNLSSTSAIDILNGSGASAFRVNSAGNSVGIGTSTLTYNLNVAGSQASTYIARINNADTSNTADGLLISLGVANASRGTGNYFVGFSDGSQTVAGKIQGGANAVAYTTTSADLAEFFRMSDLDDKPKAGEIVMLDTSKEKSVLRAQPSQNATAGEADQNGVEPLGIVSTNPGFVGNGPICLVGDGDCDQNYAQYNVLVSIAGQVPVKISDENGPIAIGDYLTLSSTTPGVAVKMIDSGYIVGVAVGEATSTTFHTPESNMASSTSYTETTALVFIKSGWREVEGSKTLVSADGLSQLQVPSRWFGLFEFFKQIGLEIGGGFIKIANLVTEKITSKTVQTEQLCIDDVCVNKEQLAAMLAASGTTPAPAASTTPPVIEEPIASTTPEVIPEPTASITPPTVETSPVIEPAPEPVIEPVVPPAESVIEPAPVVAEPVAAVTP